MLIDGGGGTAGLFPHYPAAPSMIESAAEVLDSTYGELSALSTDVDVAHAAARTGVAGLLAGPMACAPLPVKDNARDVMGAAIVAAGAVRVFGEAVTTYNSKIDALNARWSSASATDFGVPAASYPPDATPQQRSKVDDDRAGAVSAARAALLQELRFEKERCDSELDAKATTAASRLDRGPTMEVIRALYAEGGLPSTTALAFPTYGLATLTLTALPSDFADMTAEQRAAYVMATPSLPANVIRSLDQATIDILGSTIADQARVIDYGSSPEELDAVAALLTRFAPFANVNAVVLRSLGGQELIRLVSVAGQGLFLDEDSARTFASSVRGALWSGERALSESESRALAGSLVNYFRAAVITHEGELDGNAPYALSYLLRDGTFSTPFLDTMGDELDALERSFPEGYTWSQMSIMARGGGGLFAEDVADGAYDPFASYMSALGNNGEASLQFFTEGDNRQEYYIGHRYWGHDDFEGLLAALDSATTDPGNLADPASAEQAARLMSSTVDYLANRDTLEWGRDGEEFNPGDVNDAGTRSLAHMLGTYMPSVDVALEARLPDGSQVGEVQPITAARIGPMANMPIFEASELKGLVNVAVSQEGGFAEMRSQVSAYQAYQLHHSIAEHGYIDADTSNADARIEGFFVNAVGDTEIDAAADHDARVQAWIDLGKDAAGAIPIPGGSFVDFLASGAIELTADQLSEAYTNAEQREVDNSNEFATASLDARKDAFAAALVNAGSVDANDVAGVLPRGQYTAEQVASWFPDGRFPTPEQYAQLPPDDQNALDSAMLTLMGARDENGNLRVDLNEYNQNYKDMFSEYFEQGDGDGN